MQRRLVQRFQSNAWVAAYPGERQTGTAVRLVRSVVGTEPKQYVDSITATANLLRGSNPVSAWEMPNPVPQ